MKKLIQYSKFYIQSSLSFLRESFDPALEKSPYIRALRRSKKGVTYYSHGFSTRRQIIFR